MRRHHRLPCLVNWAAQRAPLPTDLAFIISRAMRGGKLYSISDRVTDVTHPPKDDRAELDHLLAQGNFTPPAPFAWLECCLDHVSVGAVVGFAPKPQGGTNARAMLAMTMPGGHVSFPFADAHWSTRRDGGLILESVRAIVSGRLARARHAHELVATVLWPIVAAFGILNDPRVEVTSIPVNPEYAATLTRRFGARADGYSVHSVAFPAEVPAEAGGVA